MNVQIEVLKPGLWTEEGKLPVGKKASVSAEWIKTMKENGHGDRFKEIKAKKAAKNEAV
jgi:hypothetical protein